MKVVKNGIYSTIDGDIILIEEITDKLITILNMPGIITITHDNKKICSLLNNIDPNIKINWRQYYSKNLFTQMFENRIDGFLGEFKKNDR